MKFDETRFLAEMHHYDLVLLIFIFHFEWPQHTLSITNYKPAVVEYLASAAGAMSTLSQVRESIVIVDDGFYYCPSRTEIKLWKYVNIFTHLHKTRRESWNICPFLCSNCLSQLISDLRIRRFISVTFSFSY